ncbi:MAG TPA: glycosyltransferase, partial [Methylomicrobium sp.]|nr:glycosyltransferase [Methylomicrobium sp.]
MNPANMNNLPTQYPKMTIITPSLNQGQFIDATIRSVIFQDYPNLEYIIMDGGSSDNTLAILHSYSDRVKWVSEKDEGQTNAINKGLYMASGEVLAYLNADDLLLPGTLIKVAQKF